MGAVADENVICCKCRLATWVGDIGWNVPNTGENGATGDK